MGWIADLTNQTTATLVDLCVETTSLAIRRSAHVHEDEGVDE